MVIWRLNVIAVEPFEDIQHELNEFLEARLPRYMIPLYFLALEQFELTANGKVDRQALPHPDLTAVQSDFVAAATDTEKALCAIVGNILGLNTDNISTDVDFFSLGVHSLMSIRLVSEIAKQLHVEVAVKSIFENPTIAYLARAIDKASEQNARPRIVPVKRNGEPLPLSFAQQRLWFINALQGESVEYNMPAAFDVTGDFDVDAAEYAFKTIIERHEVLRTGLPRA